MARGHEILAESVTPDGEPLRLTLEHGDHVVRVAGEVLMSSRQRGSEQAMAQTAFDAIRPRGKDSHVLVGGLGLGYTLRALLDRFGAGTTVVVCELLEDVVSWNAGPLAAAAGAPLEDARVTVLVADVMSAMREGQNFDAILLDVDNGPAAFTVRSNEQLYAAAGLASIYSALRPGGVMVLWSAFASRPFERALKAAGFANRTVRLRARPAAGKGARHTLFVATRPARPQHSKPA